MPELLRTLELAGCIVTLDAMGCQRRIAREIQEADADYVLALKGNQGTAHAEIQSYLDAAIAGGDPALVHCEEVEKGHGRVETRRCWQSADIGWFADRAQWEGLRSVGCIEAVRESHGHTSTERRYYLSSLGLDATRLARAVRSHWGVENQLHWVLDVVFGEDQNRARTGHAAENLATLRRWGAQPSQDRHPQSPALHQSKNQSRRLGPSLSPPSPAPPSKFRCVSPEAKGIS